MHEFMKILLSLSVSGTLLLLILLGSKQLYKNKFSRGWQYYIWIIAALRFLLPFTPDTTVVGSLFETFDTTVIANEIPTSQNAPVSANMDNSKAEPIQAGGNKTAAAATAAHKPFSPYTCLFFVWSALALILFVRKITVYQDFIRYIRTGNTEVLDLKILNLLSDCKDKLNIKTKVELFCNPLIASPMLIGFFRPAIILPAGEPEDKALSYIFMHELIHCRQKDIFYKWLIQIVVCIHWFNPFVYLLEKEVNKSCELSCDEKVLSVLDNKARREYGDTLISFLKSDNLYKNSFASVTLTEGAEQVKERLGAIMNFRKKSKGVIVFTVIFSAVVCICFLGIGAYAAPSAANDSGMVWKDSEILNDVLAEDGVYYIFCDGAGENDKPAASVSKGSFAFVLVRKDSYTFIGPFDNRETLMEDVMKQCEYMKTLTQEEKELVIETAAKICKNNDSYEYTYTQNGYYCNSFIIEMGWNLNVKDQQYYGSEEIALKDKTKMTVYFSEAAKDYMNDSDAVAAIEELIDSLKSTNVSPAIEKPLILSVTPVAADDIPALTEKYFQNEDLIRFSALFPVLDKATQKAYCQKIYEADKIAFFSTIIRYLDEDSILLYVDRSEQDDKTNFFAMLSDYMQTDDLKRYAEKYYDTGNIARFAILLNHMTKEEKQEWLIKAQADKKINFIAVLYENYEE